MRLGKIRVFKAILRLFWAFLSSIYRLCLIIICSSVAVDHFNDALIIHANRQIKQCETLSSTSITSLGIIVSLYTISIPSFPLLLHKKRDGHTQCVKALEFPKEILMFIMFVVKHYKHIRF